MLEVAGLLTVPEHSNRLSHAASDSGEVESAEISGDLLSDDDAGDKQIADGPLEKLLVRVADDAEHSVLILELVEVEEFRQLLILIVTSDGAER